MIRELNTDLLKVDFEFKEYRIHINKRNNYQLIAFSLLFLIAIPFFNGDLKIKLLVELSVLFFLFNRIYLNILHKAYIVVNNQNIYFNEVKIPWKEVNRIKIEVKSNDLDEDYIYYFYTNNKMKFNLRKDLELSPEAIETIFVNYFYKKVINT